MFARLLGRLSSEELREREIRKDTRRFGKQFALYKYGHESEDVIESEVELRAGRTWYEVRGRAGHIVVMDDIHEFGKYLSESDYKDEATWVDVFVGAGNATVYNSVGEFALHVIRECETLMSRAFVLNPALASIMSLYMPLSEFPVKEIVSVTEVDGEDCEDTVEVLTVTGAAPVPLDEAPA